MSNAQLSKPVRVMAGLYRGTMTVDGRTFDYEVERGVVGVSCDRGDGGWWRTIVDHDGGAFDYPTMAAALQSLEGEWCIDPVWGLCRS